MPKSKAYDQNCNIAGTLDIIGDRWTLLVIRDLFEGKTKFTELKQSLEGIATNVLSDRLQMLEKEELVTSQLYSQHPPRYEYQLTKKGWDLRHILNALAIWGNKYLPEKYKELVHTECGHEVDITYRCPHCEVVTNTIKYVPIHG